MTIVMSMTAVGTTQGGGKGKSIPKTNQPTKKQRKRNKTRTDTTNYKQINTK